MTITSQILLQDKVHSGSISYYYGPMYSGKSKLLIEHFESLRTSYPYRNIICFSATGQEEIVSRFYPDQTIPARPYSDVARLEEEHFPSDSIILIDEVQMIAPEDFKHILTLAQAGYHIQTYGLDLTYTGEPFAVVPLLQESANFIVPVTGANCHVCRQPATRTQRLLDGSPVQKGGPLIVLDTVHGGKTNFTYEARCLEHFKAPA